VTDHDRSANHGLLSLADHQLATAAHAPGVTVRRLDAAGFHDEVLSSGARGPGVAEQTSTIEALLHGAYEGDVTFAELARHGDLGLGTVQHLDGEMLLVDGEFLQVRADGTVHPIPPETRTPFAVLCRFRPDAAHTLAGPMGWPALQALLDDHGEPHLVQALRIDAHLARVELRSVPSQTPPYPPLIEVVAHQRSWQATDVRGTLVGFRFPGQLEGLEVAGLHVHFVSDDRTVGGHVTDLELISGTLWVQQLDELHVEVPDGVDVEPSGARDLGATIRSVEGGRAGRG
jgi:acetolactate decarboxylase